MSNTYRAVASVPPPGPVLERWGPLLLVACVLMGTTVGISLPTPARIVQLVVVSIFAAFAVALPGRPLELSTRHPAALPAGATGLLAGTAAWTVTLSWPFPVVVSVGFIVLVVAAAAFAVIAPAGSGRWLAPLTVLVFTAGHIVVVLSQSGRPPEVDTLVFATEGARSLVGGADPYATTIPNIYSPELTARFYGPGVVEGGTVTVGYPYLPTTLLSWVPGYLLGDVRLSSALLVGGVALVVLVVGRFDLRSRAAALALVVSAEFLVAVLVAVTEPAQVALAVLAALALRTRRLMVAAVLVGLVFATKQYLVVVLPCLWLLRGLWRPRHVAVAAVAALGITGPFVLWDPAAFIRSTVWFQLVQPFRPESISWAALLNGLTGWPPQSWLSVLPLAVGVAVATALTWYLRPGPAAFFLACALSLLGFVLTSKQAFPNYFLFIAGLLIAAALAASESDPARRSETELDPTPVRTVRSAA